MLELLYENGTCYGTYDEDRIYYDCITSDGDMDWDSNMMWCRNVSVIRYFKIEKRELDMFAVDLDGEDEKDILRDLGFIRYEGETYSYTEDCIIEHLEPGLSYLAEIALIMYRMIRHNLTNDYIFVQGDSYDELKNTDIEYLAYIEEKCSKKFGFKGTVKINASTVYDMTGDRLCSIDGNVMKLCEVKEFIEKNYEDYYRDICGLVNKEEHITDRDIEFKRRDMLSAEKGLQENPVICHNWEEVKQAYKFEYIRDVFDIPKSDLADINDIASNLLEVDKTAPFDMKRVDRLNDILFDCFITYGCKVTNQGLQLKDTPDIPISNRALELFDMLCQDKHILIFDSSKEDMNDRGIDIGVRACLMNKAFDFRKVYILDDEKDSLAGLFETKLIINLDDEK